MGLRKFLEKADLGASKGSIEEWFSKDNGWEILEDENIRKVKNSFLCFIPPSPKQEGNVSL